MIRSLEDIRDLRPMSIERDPRFDCTLTVLDYQGKPVGYITIPTAQAIATWVKGQR
jgi:hypothetical protein